MLGKYERHAGNKINERVYCITKIIYQEY